MTHQTELAAALESWEHEQQSAYLYNVLVQCVATPTEKHLFAELAKDALEQGMMWRQQINKLGGATGSYRPTLRVHIVAWLVKRLGPRSLRTILAAMKVRGMSIYSNTEVGHAMPQSLDDVGRSHKSVHGGNNLRAAVFGMNDGLLSNVSLILGMAGGQADNKIITLAGIAGLLAGAFSMAAGEFVSVRAQREMLEYQISQERKELELYPQEEAAELSLIYQARGLSQIDATNMANTIMQDPENALNTLAREELGLDPDHLGSPISAAFFSFVSFSLGAFIPLFPFLLRLNRGSVGLAIGLTALTLLGIGAALSLYTGRSAIKSGLRMLFIGLIAGSVTYSIGHLLVHFLN